MDKPYKPEGYNSVSPYFIVAGAQAFIQFLEQVFNASVCRRFDTPDGRIMHAEVRIEDSIIMLADATDQYPANKLVMHVYVPDAEAIYNKAIAYGCTSVEKPITREGDPDKRGTFIDPAGNMWSVGTQQ